MPATAVVVIGLVAVALLAMALRRRGDSRGLGSVSRGWIIEHRTGHRDERV
jgi:hypothetical protein